MTIAPFLALALIALAVALIAGRCRRKPVVHNTISIDLDCDTSEAREGIRQITAEIERLNAELLKADRHIMGLKVRTMEAKEAGQKTREVTAAPKPARKKAAQKR
jgi:hypothetical protein